MQVRTFKCEYINCLIKDDGKWIRNVPLTIQIFCFFPWNVFRMIPAINGHCFHKQHYLPSLCN